MRDDSSANPVNDATRARDLFVKSVRANAVNAGHDAGDVPALEERLVKSADEAVAKGWSGAKALAAMPKNLREALKPALEEYLMVARQAKTWQSLQGEKTLSPFGPIQNESGKSPKRICKDFRP